MVFPFPQLNPTIYLHFRALFEKSSLKTLKNFTEKGNPNPKGQKFLSLKYFTKILQQNFKIRHYIFESTKVCERKR